jgi:hypothetical protein
MAARERNAAMSGASSIRFGLAISQPIVAIGLLWKIAQKWVGEDREPSEAEKGAATVASSALLASRRVMTDERTNPRLARTRQRLTLSGPPV